jgi:hypothetical protein
MKDFDIALDTEEEEDAGTTRMLMVEDDSIRSEDIVGAGGDASSRGRPPCEFIPPPPPTEPPPPDSVPVDLDRVMNRRVAGATVAGGSADMGVGVNEDTNSIGPSSTKSSPISSKSGGITHVYTLLRYNGGVSQGG